MIDGDRQKRALNASNQSLSAQDAHLLDLYSYKESPISSSIMVPENTGDSDIQALNRLQQSDTKDRTEITLTAQPSQANGQIQTDLHITHSPNSKTFNTVIIQHHHAQPGNVTSKRVYNQFIDSQVASMLARRSAQDASDGSQK